MNDIFKTYKGLPKEAYYLCIATLINRLGDFVVPFLTLFLTVKLNMNSEVSGIIVTAASIISIPSSVIGGKISDTLGKKKVYFLGQGLSGILLILCGVFQNPTVIITFLLLSTFFNGTVRPAFQALLIDHLPRERRQAGMSLNYLCINIGVSIGPIIAGMLFNNFLALFFIGDGITSVFAALFVAKNVSEVKVLKDNKINDIAKGEEREEGNIFTVLLKRPQLLMFFALLILYQFIYTQNRFTLPLTVNNAVKNNGAEVFGYLMSINAVTVVTLTVFITAAVKKLHHLSCIVLGGLAYAVGFGMLAFVNNKIGFVISTFIWTLGEILNSISQGVFVADNSPVNYRARISAMHNIVYFIGSSLSTAVVGVIIAKLNIHTTWIIIFFISIIASILMYCLKVYCVKYVDCEDEVDSECNA